jgi:lipoyl(octanoyl) transferase
LTNEQNHPTSDLGTKDYKETWEYQEELFKGIDLKFEIAEKS